MTRRRSLDHLSVGLLGLVTISAYGSWYYAFGALLDSIRDDTGWSESSLAASFAAGTVLVGVGSVAGGRLLDRVGVRPVFLLAAFGGGAAFFVASAAQGVVVFAAASAAGMGLYGSLGFYHVTMTAVVRVNPLAPAPAIASLTLWGALASAIYLPLTAGLLGALDWRSTVRVLALLASAGFLLAALAVPDRPRGGSAAPDGEQRSPFGPGSARPPLREVLAAAVAPGGPRAFTLAVALAGIAISTVLVYQVPAMTAAGLPLGTAAAIAGIRGIGPLG
ncbi:MAG: MFS transporter, partial [Acidimicrobiales bacterium]